MEILQDDHAQLSPVRVRMLPDGRMTRRDAAAYLGLKPKTLAMWAVDGRGPKSMRVGGRCFYFKDALDAFIRGEAAFNTANGEPEVAYDG